MLCSHSNFLAPVDSKQLVNGVIPLSRYTMLIRRFMTTRQLKPFQFIAFFYTGLSRGGMKDQLKNTTTRDES